MKLAVLSDTHDRKENILKAVSIINEKNVDVLIHCGDYVAAFVKDWFNNLNESIKNEHFFGVWGNNDGERLYLKQYLGQICNLVGIEFIKEFDGKKIHASHMPSLTTVDALASSGKFDIVLSGHTHISVNKKHDNGVLEVNPGELCGYLTGKATFAIVDTNRMKAEIIELWRT